MHQRGRPDRLSFRHRQLTAPCLLIAAAFLLTNGAGDPAARASEAEGAAPGSAPAAESAIKAANFRAKDLKGQTVELSDLLKEGPVFLHFWTTWCPSCQREMAKLDELHRRYRDNGFHVVAVAQDDAKTLQKIKPLVTGKKLLITVIVDSNKEIGNRYNVRQYPTCYLIAKDGSIAQFVQGYIPGDEDHLESIIRTLLGLPLLSSPEGTAP